MTTGNLKEEYPEIYETLEDFVEILSDEQKSLRAQEELLSFYRKNLPHMSGRAWYFEEYPEDRFEPGVKVISDGLDGTPYVRETKKIGRNDPVPAAPERNISTAV